MFAIARGIVSLLCAIMGDQRSNFISNSELIMSYQNFDRGLIGIL